MFIATATTNRSKLRRSETKLPYTLRSSRMSGHLGDGAICGTKVRGRGQYHLSADELREPRLCLKTRRVRPLIHTGL